jgi:hypothetical protein
MENFGIFAVYMMILTAVSILAPFVIEGIKNFLNATGKKYDAHILSLMITIFVSLAACIFYMVICKIYPTPGNVACVIGVVFFSVLGALNGYDKMFKILFQLFEKMNKREEV